MIWDSPFSPYTNYIKFPFPPSESLAWDFPLLPWRTVTCPSAHQISCYSFSSLSKHKEEGKTNPTPSYQLLQAAVSLGKNVTPHLSVDYRTGLGFLGKKNAFICPGFPIRQPFYCSPPSCMVFFPLSDTPAVGPVPLPKAALCPGHKESAQGCSTAHVFHCRDLLPSKA